MTCKDCRAAGRSTHHGGEWLVELCPLHAAAEGLLEQLRAVDNWWQWSEIARLMKTSSRDINTYIIRGFKEYRHQNENIFVKGVRR